MVHGHLDNPVPQQERSLRGENKEISFDDMFPGICRWEIKIWVWLRIAKKDKSDII